MGKADKGRAEQVEDHFLLACLHGASYKGFVLSVRAIRIVLAH